MKVQYLKELAFQGLRAKRVRTFLTLLGIAIGIASVILIASLGAGTRNLVTGEVSTLGADVLSVQPGKKPSGFADIASVFYSKTLKERDLRAILKKSNVPHVLEAHPFVMVPGAIRYGREVYYPQIVGGSAKFYERSFDVHPREGIMFDETAIREKAPVAVIGYTVSKELFGQTSALGKKVDIGGKKFKVVGVLPKLGQVAFTNTDELVLVPYTTAMTYLLGQTHYNEIIVRVDDPKNLLRTERDIQLTLRELHHIAPGDDDDFAIRTPAALMEQIDAILLSLTVFLIAVVSIALLVGGIGIMNIMLVSVTERTKEIGLRKAVGARDKDILLQFLVESVLLTLLGGVLGIVAGMTFSYIIGGLIQRYTSLDWVVDVPFNAILLAFAFSVVVGVVFGLYPARKAAQKSPLQALRHE